MNKTMSAVLLCVAGALVCSMLRVQKPEFRTAAAIAVGLCALGLSMDGISKGVELLRDLWAQGGLNGDSVSVMLRASGVALLVEFGAQLCRDADESALAGRVELAGRAALLGMSVPLLGELARSVTQLLP